MYVFLLFFAVLKIQKFKTQPIVKKLKIILNKFH